MAASEGKRKEDDRMSKEKKRETTAENDEEAYPEVTYNQALSHEVSQNPKRLQSRLSRWAIHSGSHNSLVRTNAQESIREKGSKS